MTVKKKDKKPAVKKPVLKGPAKKVAVKSAAKPAAKVEIPEEKPRVMPKVKLSAKDKQDLTDNLLRLRQQLSEQIMHLRDDSLTRQPSDNTDEDGTDAFERQVSLNLVSSEHDEIVQIDDALRRIDEGTYGVCEDCLQMIEKPRIKALPFVCLCVKCQSETEKGKTRYRPLSQDSGF